ncbi:MAG TPA: hypothetical protein VFG44_01010 [Burkholderiales bacterium]|nr:hypothetical protein [Burkholderiales bacterium]
MTNHYKSILIVGNSDIGLALIQVAQVLKEKHGSRLVLVVNTAEDRALFERRYPGLFDAIEESQFRYRSVMEPMSDDERWFAEARDLELRYAFKFAHLLMDDRHFGIGFSAGGTRYPETAWNRRASYAKAVRSYVLFVRFFERLFDEHGTTLVLNPLKSCEIVARGRGVPTRTLTAACFKNYWTWACNEFMESNLLPEAYRAASSEPAEQVTGHYDIYLQTRQDMLRRFRLPATLRNIGYEFARYVYCHARRLQKRFGLRPFETAAAHVRIWADYRKLRRHKPVSLAALDGKDFVYLPLSVEPEVTLTRESPEFNHQAFAVHAIASNLPAGTVLAVKEHLSTIGTRPKDFYRSLAKIPNVVLLDPLEWGLDVMRKSRAVATINGTSGFEAAAQGIPVLTFSVHNKYNLMPHVRVVSGWHDMPAALAEVLAASAQEPGMRISNGNKYLNALTSISIDCGNANFRKGLEPGLVDAMTGLLDRTLAAEAKAEPRELSRVSAV